LYTWFWWGSLRERDHLEDPCVDGRLILKWIFNKWDEGHGLDGSGSGQVEVAGTSECGNEPTGSIKWGVCLD
jgi:hypothetical protein